MDTSIYSLKPFIIIKINPKERGFKQLKPRSGHRIVADTENVYCFGGYNPNVEINYEATDDDWLDHAPLFDELWQFNTALKKWTKLQDWGEGPVELASHCAILSNNKLFVFGGTGVPFGSLTSNRLSACDLSTLQWSTIQTFGDVPEKRYGQAMVAHQNKLYVVGGTSGYQFSIEVHVLDASTMKWQTFKVTDQPETRYRHEIAVYQNQIYVFGGGKTPCCYGFNKVPVFDLATSSWSFQTFLPDLDVIAGSSSTQMRFGFPRARRCHGLVQMESDVFIIGGYNGSLIFADIWKANLESKKWTKLKCTLPLPVYFHSVALNPLGKLYIFGGVTDIRDQIRTNESFEMWLKVPKLKEACWEAILHYMHNIDQLPRKRLLEIGIPNSFLKRLDCAKQPESTSV